MQIVLPIKNAEISAMADYCDPELMLITETKLDLQCGGVMIVTKDCYTITDLVLPTTPKILFTDPQIKGQPNFGVNYPRLHIRLGTTPKLLSFWAVILTQGVLTGKLD